MPSGLKGVVATSCLLVAAISPWLVSTPEAKGEPAACLSQDPAQWPAPSKPYFMIIVDTSGSMITNNVGSANSCGYNTSGVAGNSNRIDHARCAVTNTINAYAGQVNFGLAGYAWKLSGCSSGCYSNCAYNYSATDANFCGPLVTEPALGSNIHHGGLVFVPMLQDHFWATPPALSNVSTLLSYVDNNCTSSVELGANSNTPIAGSLFDVGRYYGGTYNDPITGTALATPIGTTAQGERSCRPLNIILITDGDETCDTAGPGVNGFATGCFAGAAYPNGNGQGLAAYEAAKLFVQGVTPAGSSNFKVKTHIIGFSGLTAGGQAALNDIANCGGTGAAYSTANEAGLAAALSSIIAGSVAPETCDNADNNCNGCTD